MAYSKEIKQKLISLFQDDLEKPLTSEKLAEKIAEILGQDGRFVDFLAEKIRRDRIQEIQRSQRMWFGSLGWWFARIFMWGSFAAGLLGVLIFGKAAADPLTYGLLGAAAYYVVIQVFTPFRLSRLDENIKNLDSEAAERMKTKLDQLEKEFFHP